MADQQSEIDRLKSELERERETSDSLRSERTANNDKLMAIAAVLGLRVDNSIPSLDLMVQSISALKSRSTLCENMAREAQAEVKRLTIALEAEKAKDDLASAAPY